MKKKKDKPSAVSTAATVQTGKKNHPFMSVSSYSPLQLPNTALYRSLREAVPIIDACILKLVRLLGCFKIESNNKKAERLISSFLETVNVGGQRTGIDAFISTFFEQLLTDGTAVGEMVVTNGQISHLYNAPLSCVRLETGANALDICVKADNGYGRFEPVQYPSLIVLGVHNPSPGRIYGTSVLEGLPFVSDILLKVYNTIGVNWDRVGNVRYCVTYKPQNDVMDKAYAQERTMQVAEQWSRAMDPNGPVRDFVAVGDVEIKAIGADNQILDSEVPVRQMLEQIVAKFGIPPFLLGLNWSSTERMSSQQADILTSEIDAYRREVDGAVRKICDTFLRLEGIDCEYSVVWDDITLQDIEAISKSGYYTALKEKIYKEMEMTASDE